MFKNFGKAILKFDESTPEFRNYEKRAIRIL
jgi:hypothetical protein